MPAPEEAHGPSTLYGLVRRRLLLQEAAALVERTQWANDFSASELETFLKYVQFFQAQKGSTLAKEGSREAYLCLVIQGNVIILKEGTSGQAKQIGAIGPGRTFGEMSIIDGEPRSASVVADEATTIAVLTAYNFNRLSSDVPRLALKVVSKIAKLISQRLRQTSGTLVDHLGDS